jgi:branched-chain amino acid transport system substrate-binding protein
MVIENNKKTLAIFLVLLFAVLIGFIILSLNLTGHSISNKESIKIGAVFHLTGPGSFWGEGEKNAVILAIDKANAKGGVNGKQIELIIEDSKTDFQATSNSIKKLIEIDNTKVIIGPTWFGQIASPLAEQYKTLIVSPSAGVVPKPSSYFFDLWPTEKQEVTPVINFMQEKGIRKVVLIYSLNDFTQSVRSNFVEQAKTKDIDIVREFAVNPGESDFRTIIAQIKELNVDAIYATFAFYPSQGAFSKQAKELNLNLTVYSSSGTEIPDLLKAYPEIEGTIYGYISINQGELDFNSEYIERFNSYPSPSSSYAYDAANLIIDALKADKNTPEKISSYLHTINYQGISNTISFNNEGRISNKEFVIKTVKNGQFVIY